ncbi:MAG: M23 family metallopeptidase [Saprospiraceae bacterium]|nr:M23 family metallopeptidase [Saprospiraceae bacterium]
MMIRLLGWVILVLIGTGDSWAQINPQGLNDRQGGEYVLLDNDADHPCVTEAEYALLENNCARNAKQIGWFVPDSQGNTNTLLEWPLRTANGLMDCSYYVISAFVDQDISTGSVKDYACGSRTYDGHRGTDIALFPYRFIKMDNDQVEVIAAASGTILDKSDGNTDKNCGSNMLQANYIMIGHSDGSRALYFHMKKNSVTTKSIGETVEAGEYLGVIGSSGNSSGPHLHFEVWSGSTVATRIDPFYGPCNTLNSTTWWQDQKPYSETAVVKVSTNATDVVIPACPETETPNEQACFSLPFQGPGLPAGYAKFYMFLRQETAGLTATLRILHPDHSVYLSWMHNSTNTYTSSWWGFSKKLPANPGRYTFEVDYNGTTCSSEFEVLNALVSVQGQTTICPGDSVRLSANEGFEFLWNDGQTTQDVFAKEGGNYQVTIQGEFGCSSTSPALDIFEYSPMNGLFILMVGDTLISPYDNEVYWYLNGISDPVDSGKMILCPGDGLYIAEGLDANGCRASSQALDVVCQMTALSEAGNASSIRVFPNPTSGRVAVDLGDRRRGPYELTICNLTGQQLFKKQMPDTGWSGFVEIHLGDYPDGLLVLMIQGTTWMEQRLLIKQH